MSKRGIQYVQNEQPAFLKRMKEQAGYVEPDTVETKFVKDKLSDSEDSEKEDEKPQVVVLKSGDLTEREADHASKISAVTPREVGTEKVLFKKPKKLKDNKEDKSETTETENKTKKSDEKTVKKKNRPAIKNKSLLSFNEEEDG